LRTFLTPPLRYLLASLLLALPLAAQRPQLQMQTGHTGGVEKVLYSPDGRLLASSSDDSTVKVWDVATGRELRTFTSLTTQAPGLAFSRDGSLLAASDYNGNVAVWSLREGTQQTAIKNGIAILSVAFSPDGRWIAGVGEPYGSSTETQKRCTVWKVADGSVVQAWHLPEAARAVVFTPDGKDVVTAADNDGGIVFLNPATVGVDRKLVGHTKLISGLVFSGDGRMLVSSSWDHFIRIWDVASGTSRELPGGKYEEIYSVAISPDEKRLVSTGDDTDGRVKVWNVADGQMLYAIKFADTVASATFSPDGRTLAVATGKEGITLHDASDGRRIGSFTGTSKGGLNSVLRLAMTANGRTLAGARLHGGVELWDLVNSTMRVYGKNESGFTSVALTADGRLLAAGTEGKILLWSTATGEVLYTFQNQNGAHAVVFSHDGKWLFGASKEGESHRISIWDTATGAGLRVIDGINDFPNQIALSPDGKILVAGTMKARDNIQLFNVADGSLIRTLSGHVNYVSAVAVSPDGRTLASSSADEKVMLWNVADGTRLRTIDLHDPSRQFSSTADSLTFSPDGKMLVSGSRDRSIRIWDTQTGALQRSLAGHTDEVCGLAFSPDGRILYSGSRDTTVRVWNVAEGKMLGTMIGGGGKTDDWMVVTPDGLFDGTPQAWRHLDWRFSPALTDISPVELFFNEFYYPNLLGDLVAGRQVKAVQDIASKDRRQPQVKLTADSEAGMATARIAISNAPAGAEDVRLFRNGSLVRVWHGDVLGGKAEATLTAQIPVVAGENRLTAYAFNHDNVKSADAALVVTGAETLRRKGTAYVLAAGVNRYANPDFDLKYAVADAQDFSAEWPVQQAKLSAYAQTQVTMLTDAKATKAAILAVLADLATKAKPEDAVVVYFAGHGTAQANRFYLIPHDLGYAGGRDAIDEAGLQTILTHSISDLELQAAIEKIDAGQLLMVIDACNSGQALESEEKRRGPMNSKGLAQLAYEKGMYILTAAQSYQAAQEASKFGGRGREAEQGRRRAGRRPDRGAGVARLRHPPRTADAGGADERSAGRTRRQGSLREGRGADRRPRRAQRAAPTSLLSPGSGSAATRGCQTEVMLLNP